MSPRAVQVLNAAGRSTFKNQRGVELRRARCLVVFWNDSRLAFHNYATRETTLGLPITCNVLDFFERWRTPQRAIAHFRHFTSRSVKSSLKALLQNGLLVQKNSPAARLDDLIAKTWAPWLPDAAFHFSTKNAVYARRHWSSTRWKAVLPKTPQPGRFKTTNGSKTQLPAKTFPDSEFIRTLMARKTHRRFSKAPISVGQVSQLLSLVWGVTGYLYSPVFGKLLRKTSPSAGARHPGEVYLMALRVKGLSRGLYHYHPRYHRLEAVNTTATSQKAWQYCARQDHAKGAAALFLMTAVFARTMWKYHQPRAYRVVLLDAGHLCQTFCLVATWLGLAPFCTAALDDTLIEDDLGIDGVAESVLYIAGVGLPKRVNAVAHRIG